MLTSSRSGIISSVGHTPHYYTTTDRDIHSQPTPSEGKYDSITLSSNHSERSSFMDLVGRLTQEVRTTTTTGDIRALRQQVASGQYEPNAAAIAARMLFLGEDA